MRWEKKSAQQHHSLLYRCPLARHLQRGGQPLAAQSPAPHPGGPVPGGPVPGGPVPGDPAPYNAPVLLLAAAFILSYLLGSLVAGVVYSRLRGDDIRTRDLPGGSGTYRQYGRGAAVLVSLVDILKGALAVMLAEQIAPGSGWLATSGVVLGHCYPVWFGLRGGGGIAPFLGALLVVAPWTMLATLALALAVIPVYRATAQARLRLNAIPFAAALALPLGALIATRLGGLGEFLAGSAAMALRAGHLLAEGRGKA